jgi:predicted component of viral defense system (DUF524 family)
VCFLTDTDSYICINNLTFIYNRVFADNYVHTNQRVDCWANDALKPEKTILEKTMPEKIKPDKGHQQP